MNMPRGEIVTRGIVRGVGVFVGLIGLVYVQAGCFGIFRVLRVGREGKSLLFVLWCVFFACCMAAIGTYLALASYRLVVKFSAPAIRRFCVVMAIASFWAACKLADPIMEATGPSDPKHAAAVFAPLAVAYAVYKALPWILIKLTDAEDRTEDQ